MPERPVLRRLVAAAATRVHSADLTGKGLILDKLKYKSWSVFGRFSAKLGPGTVTNGSGLQNVA